MSSSRDFNAPFANYRRNRSRSRDRFSRPGPSRIASGDHVRDRDRERDRDRHHEREPRDRDRRNDRDRDLDLARTIHTPQDQPAKMDPDRASAELAKALHQVTDLMTQRTQLSLKRDAELKAYHKRKQDYDCQISKPVQFPAVHDAFQGSQNHHKQTLAGIDKELAVLASKETVAFDKYAQTLVRALPFDEIKIRQILEASKGELGLVTTSSQSAQEERLKKLDQRQAGFEETWKKQIASLKETQDKQASELAAHREKDILRADLAKENEQLRAQVTSLRSEVTSLAQRLGAVEPTESFRAYVDKQIGELKAELSKIVEEVRLDSTAKTTQDKPSAVQNGSLLQDMADLGQKCGELSREIENLKDTSTSHTERIAALDTGVKDHEALLANIDVENLDETMADYAALKSRADAQDMVIEGAKRSVAECLARIPQKMPADLPASFRAWSDRFMQVFATKLDEHTAQIKSLQDSKSATGTVAVAQASRPATASTPRISTSLAPESEAVASGVTSAESRLTEVESKTVAIDLKVTALQETVTEVQKIVAGSQDSINALGSQADRRYGALETMVESLSSQWNNTSTTQMAHAILEQLSRLQPAQLVPEIRHFQERLSDVEKLVQEDGEQRKNLSMGMQSVCDDIAKAPKRGLGPEEKFPGHHDKRARIEGQNGVNGYGNGYVHP
ncbi:hypothetical protein INS49_011725 [Diaporthe citri]|uniref:uncharacterized protein n=1 Tax=Diaporthe citri TaxID=83186 RepID=UPI001C81667C|nr:uncharacterized protein INS49_011725 [Diaporthe citri]KAG6360660.1 hypothetical protein INS49_011725 [Diaporthe citri]